ncbi:MAG: DUF4250 domain-containing protein [Eubacteriales bacterium]|nr:DUF4250 domain-containing protein [Eubacteriales bacterium]
MLPQDPIILLSYVNTKLRDGYASLELLCDDMHVDRSALTNKLEAVNYFYDAEKNQFV